MSTAQNKKIGLFQCISLVAGNLIGSGIFMLPAFLAIYGTVSIVGWILTSIGAITLALTFSQLSHRFCDHNGGPHSFINRAFGAEAGFWAAWGYWILTWASNTALIITAMSYLSTIFGTLPTYQVFIIEVIIWAVITGINLRGIKTAARFELFITIIKLLPIIGIPLLALPHLNLTHFQPFLHDTAPHITLMSALKATVFLTFWAFIGVESATVPSKEVNNPKKTIGRATIIGTTLAAIVYIVGSVATIGVLGKTSLAHSSAPYADLASAIFGGSWGNIIAVCAIISCIGAFNGWTLVVARIAQGASEQKLFPKIFSQKNAIGTPIKSILISAICTLITMALTLQKDILMQFNMIIDIAVTLILIIYAASIMSYFKLLKPKKISERMVGNVAMCFVVFGLYASGLTTIALAILLLLTGLPLRWWMQRKSRRSLL